ncbi:mitochondrial carrier protein [Ascodesmis nigricans]|uniref:Mitochondrial carrier protein n=1 Tax=Ascodesmis nigricans TaxID=341454 RepID=A0A4S2MPG9_9PEZI|nr:mitochondrial carrier protein [Ascodesmis nigricans]
MGDIAVDAVDAGLARTLKDLFAGAVGGVAQVLIGQPFDIVKVRLQTTQQYSSALDAATQIYKKEGALSFYKGTLTPLIGIGACVSVQFGAFYEAQRTLESWNKTHHPATPSLSFPQYYLAGAFAGLANTVLSSPIEHIRIRLQTQPHGANALYSGPLDCTRKLISQGGGITHGLYRGSVITLVREAQAYGFWFLTFEYLMSRETRTRKREDVPAWKVALYGGLAGEALWLASYPMDVVKSRLQTDEVQREKQRYRGTWDCVRKTYMVEGLGGFWRGIGPTLLRAMPVSAGTFFTVETVMRLMG